MEPAMKPSSRSHHDMAYDAESDRVILSGWRGLDDTWAYDFNSNTWTDVSSSVSPSARDNHAMAYDAESDRVILFGGSTGSDETWSYHYPPPTPPSGPPQALQATAGNAQVTLTWGAPSDDGGSPITNYRIYRGTALGDLSFLVEVENVLAYTDTGLTNGVTYYYQVSAVNAVGESPKSIEVSATPMATVPSAPQNLQASVGHTYVYLTWDPPLSDGGSAITSYRIYRSNPGDEFGVAPAILATVGNVLEYNDTTVDDTTYIFVTYVYQVSAVNAIGEGERSGKLFADWSAPPDQEDPAITIASPADGATLTSTSVTVEGTVTDDSIVKVELSLDETDWVYAIGDRSVEGFEAWVMPPGTTSWSATLTLVEGSNTIYVRATDLYENTATVSITVTVDTTPPGFQVSPTIVIVAGVGVVAAAAAVGALVMLRRRKRG